MYNYYSGSNPTASAAPTPGTNDNGNVMGPGCPSGMDTRWCYGGIPGFWAGGTQMFTFSSPTWNMFQQLQQSTSGTVAYEWKLNGNWDEVSEIYGSYYNVEDNFQTYWTLGEVDTTSSNWTWDSSMVSSMGYAIDNTYGKALGTLGQFFRGRPPGQSFAACVDQNINLTTFGLAQSSTKVLATGLGGTLLTGVGSTSTGFSLAEDLLFKAASLVPRISLPSALTVAEFGSQVVAVGGGAALGTFIGSVANCASQGVLQ